MLIDKLKNSVTKKPIIIKDEKNSFVIIGSKEHGLQIPQDSITGLINSLEGVIALKMEGSEEMFKWFHPMSTEGLVKTSLGSIPVSYLPESENIGEKLLEYEIPEEIAEIYIPCMYIRFNGIHDGFFEFLPLILKRYSEEFGLFDFTNTLRAVENFDKVRKYWKHNKLNFHDLENYFSIDFEKFIGDVMEFEYWKPDLEKFRNQYNGKIAVCCGDYHVFFVLKVFDKKEVSKPNWENHIDNIDSKIKGINNDYIDNTNDDDEFVVQYKERLKQIYQHITKALDL